MSDNRPSVYKEGDKTVWRASSLGACMSSLAYEYAGVTAQPPPAWMFKSFDEGTNAEDELLEHLVGDKYLPVTEGFNHDQSGQVLLELEFGNNIIRCHPDGIYSDTNGVHYVAEVKFLGPAMFKRVTEDLKSEHRYAWQASVEMAATGLDLLYGVGYKNAETREHEPKKFHSSILMVPPYSLGQIKQRIAKVIKMAEAADRPSGDDGFQEIPHCEYKMFPCGLWHMHRDDDPLWIRDEVVLNGDDAAIFDDIMTGMNHADDLTKQGKKDKAEFTKAYKHLVARLDIEKGTVVKSEAHEVTHVMRENTTTDWKQLCQDQNISQETIDEYRTISSTSSYPKKKAKSRR